VDVCKQPVSEPLP